MKLFRGWLTGWFAENAGGYHGAAFRLIGLLVMNPFSFVFTAAAVTSTAEPVHHAADWVGESYQTILQTLSPLYAELTDVNALKQLVAVLLACAVAGLIAKIYSQRVTYWLTRLPGSSWVNRTQRFILKLSRSLCFSVAAAVILSLCVVLFSGTDVLGPRAMNRLTIVRLGYSIFYAWALLRLLMPFLSLVMGERFFGATVRAVVSWGFWILALLQILGLMPQIVGALQRVRLPIGSEHMTLWTALVGALTVFCMVGVANWLANLCDSSIKANVHLEANLKVVLARLVRVILIVMAVLIALSSVGINLAILSVFGGAIGVGIGFGMQKIASNYISGFIILFDRSLKIGDLIEVGGFRGIITQINTRYSVLSNTVGEELIVPNESLVTATVKNYSHSENRVAVSVDMSIAYESDVDRAMAIFLQVVRAQPRVLSNPAPYCVIAELADSSVNLRATCWVEDPRLPTGILVSNIYRQALQQLTQAGIEIPYNKEDINLKGTIALADGAVKKAVVAAN